MDPAKRFLEYATAFEQTYADDDWSRLEPYFSEDAVYSSTGEAPLGGRWQGRRQVLEHLRQIGGKLDEANTVRALFQVREQLLAYSHVVGEPLGEPTRGEDFFELAWRATYCKAGCPDLVFEGTERATFEGERIRLLEDVNEEGADRRIQEYMARHLS